MILPIIAYGHPVLKEKAKEIDLKSEETKVLIDNMWQTMYAAHGVGLAAPQIGKSLRLFIVDASPFKEEDPSVEDFKKVFINPEILEETGEEWLFNEGCLSIPEVREDVSRKSTIRVQYFDENGNQKTEEFSGLAARVIQHEYDHIEGVLFTDHLSPLRKKLINGKLKKIKEGKIRADYRMKHQLKRGKR